MTTPASTPGGTLPLDGIRVLELGHIVAGPSAGLLLADLGADVVRIERPGGSTGPALPRELDLLNRNKRSVSLDLKSEEGVETALALTDRADALVEGFRPGVMERLGLGPDVCLARNPSLVYGRMTGWGQDGPLASRAGHDVNYVALSGALHAIGPRDGPPSIPLNLVGDFGGGSLYLAVGILAALLEARRSGVGQVVDAAIVDGAASLATPFFGMIHGGLWRERRGSNVLDGGCPWYGVYESADAAWVAIGPIEPQFFAEFVARLELGEDVPGQWEFARWQELRERIAARFRTRTRAEWEAVFADTDACVAPVLTWREAMAHPHMRARGCFDTVDGIAQPVPAPRFSRTPAALRHGPRASGADTGDVLRDWGIGNRG
jgi:alpha-methylacyl-CoA racemase